jgi:hypothetical protein
MVEDTSRDREIGIGDRLYSKVLALLGPHRTSHCSNIKTVTATEASYRGPQRSEDRRCERSYR